jgi:copper homeostasis protein (lipoprotein)
MTYHMRTPLPSVIALAALAASLVGGCSAARNTPGERAIALVANLPATYAGTLPCEGCPGVDFQLMLRRDNLYLLRTRYRRRDSAAIGRFDELGTWMLAADSTAVRLSNGRGDVTVALPIIDDSTLVVPEPGRAVAADTTGRLLRRLTARPPFAARLQMRGILTEKSFRECTTGLTLDLGPVPPNQISRIREQLQRGGVLVALEGMVAPSRTGEGTGDAQELHIARIESVLPGDTCMAQSPTEITGTTWELIVDASTTPTSDPERRPYFTVEAREARVSGMAGCNRFGGTAELDGATIRFGDLVLTKMACDQLDLETLFVRALESARRWRIVDGQLELLDERGAVAARFAARTAPR